jgi:hypothetical protein
MPGRRSKNEGRSEHFTLVVDGWEFAYSFRVSVDAKPDDPLGLCGEQRDVVVSGALLSKRSWGCARATLTLSSDGVEPQDWKPEWTAFGRLKGVRRGVLTGYVRLPAPSLQSFMTALAAGKVRGLYVRVDDVVAVPGGSPTSSRPIRMRRTNRPFGRFELTVLANRG